MKRLFLTVILLFPVLTLGFWFYWGYSRPHIKSNLPMATNADISTNSVTNASPPAKP